LAKTQSSAAWRTPSKSPKSMTLSYLLRRCVLAMMKTRMHRREPGADADWHGHDEGLEDQRNLICWKAQLNMMPPPSMGWIQEEVSLENDWRPE